MRGLKRLTKYWKAVEEYKVAFELAFITNQPLPKRPMYKKKPLFRSLVLIKYIVLSGVQPMVYGNSVSFKIPKGTKLVIDNPITTLESMDG